MYIKKVLSYKGAWELANSKYKNQVDELYSLIEHFVETWEKPLPASFKTSREFDSLLEENGWQEVNRSPIGLIKDGVSADLTLANPAILNRWIFHNSVVAMRKKIVELPILILPCKDDTIFDRMVNLGTSEYFEKQLVEIAPLSHQYRFLVLGLSQTKNLMPDVVELESDPLINEANQVINRIIEFPPEYHQAGIGILNFFGTYLREQYPNEEAKVKIIQEGLRVRMVIETMDGSTETIEKALYEYQLIVSGQEAPEKFATDDKLIIELKNELRIAKLRIETQQDFIGIQNNRIDRLFQIVEMGLSNKNPITIDFKPTISLSNTVQVNSDISFALSRINELKDSLPASSEAHVTLKEIEGSLEAVEKEKDPQVVRKSSAMSKFKRFIDKVAEGNNEIEKAIKAVEHGWDIFKDLSGKYNSIAQWCGLPQVPKIFTKE